MLAYRPLTWSTYDSLYYQAPNGAWYYADLNTPAYKAFKAYFDPIFEKRRHTLVNCKFEERLFYLGHCFLAMYNSEGTQPTGPTMWSDHQKDKVTSDNFQQRCLAGEIVVNDYYILDGVGEYASLLTDQNLWYSDRSYDISQMDIGANSGLIVIDGIKMYGSVKINFANVRLNESNHPIQDGITPSAIRTWVRSHDSDIDRSVVQQCLVKANAGTLDLATSLAELPETLVSIKTLFERIFDLFIAAKNKELSLTRRNKLRKDSLNLKVNSINKELQVLLAYVESLKLQKLDRDTIKAISKTRRKIRRLKRKRNNLAKDIAELAEELTTAIAGVWMNYRYNIQTNQYMIEDIVDTFDQYDREYVRYREGYLTTIEPTDLHGYKFTGIFTINKRVFIKRSYDVETLMKQLQNSLKVNLAVTLWELKKLSFVWDWFLTIGDAISAFMYQARFHLLEGACISTQIAIAGDFRTPAGSGTTINWKSYHRQVIQPTEYIGVYFRPDLNILRQLDSAALLWGQYRSDVNARIRRL